MRCIKAFLLSVCFLLLVALLSGCWNYREVESLAVVSGLAIDKTDDGYLITFEIVDVKGGKESKTSTKIVTSEGETIFDAARKTIRKAGKRLYFSHAEIVIISSQLAEEGIVPILDWIARDSETRYTLHLLVSREKSAKEILGQQPITEDILSIELNDMLRSENSLSNAPEIEEWQFMKDLAAMGVSSTLPAIDLSTCGNRQAPEITGTAIFREDKLIGFLSGEETKTLLFIKDKISGGLLVHKEYKGNSETGISLEILKNKTKLKPHYDNGKITIEIGTNTDVAIGENGGRENYIEEPARMKLKKDFEARLENNIRSLVKKMQEQYDSDIFGFGKALKVNMPDLWKKLEPQWEQVYKNVEVEVHSTINIKNSALQSKSVKVGD